MVFPTIDVERSLEVLNRAVCLGLYNCPYIIGTGWGKTSTAFRLILRGQYPSEQVLQAELRKHRAVSAQSYYHHYLF